MKSRPIVWRETGAVALGQLVCCGLMVGIFWLIGKFSTAVLLGALAGGFLATVNFFIMALCADMAADKGQDQEVKGGQALIQTSYILRMVGLFLILALLAKSGVFNVITLVLPLAFEYPILVIKEFIRKKGAK